MAITVANFENFFEKFLKIFTTDNFYDGKSYLNYIAQPQTNDEDNIVDTKIVLPLLKALGFESGDLAKNTTNSGKDNHRPDFKVKLHQENIRCFLVEDKHTAYDLSKPEPIKQLVNYAASRGYDLGLLCNGRLLLCWDLSNPNMPNLVLELNLEETLQTYLNQTTLTNSQRQALKCLYRRFGKANFQGLEILIQNISKPIDEWLTTSISQATNYNFDELLIGDLRTGIKLLEDDVLYQLELLLKDYEEYAQGGYFPPGKGERLETAPQTLIKLRHEILNYLKATGAELLDATDYDWADEKLREFANNPRGSVQELGEEFLQRLKIAQEAQKSRQKTTPSTTYQQLDLLEVKPPKLETKTKSQPKHTTLDPKLVERLSRYEELVFDWKAWQAQQNFNYEQAIKTHQYFTSWKNLITKTVLQGADETKLKEEFASQTAYVYVIRLLMVRICEDKGLINRKFSNGGFKHWIENVIPQYLDFAEGRGLDYLLELSYRSAQSIYTHFFIPF